MSLDLGFNSEPTATSFCFTSSSTSLITSTNSFWTLPGTTASGRCTRFAG